MAVDPAQIGELRRWAQQLQKESDSREARAAARAILLLADEVDRLQAERQDDRHPPEPPAGGGDRAGAPARPAPDRLTGLVRRAMGTAEPLEPPATPGQRRRLAEAHARRRRGLRRLALAIAGVAALVFATFALGAVLGAPDVVAQGPAANAVFGPGRLARAAFSIRASRSEVAHASWHLDGLDVSRRAIVVGDTAVLRAADMPDGEHNLSAHVDGSFPGASGGHTWHFTVDTTAPVIGLPAVVSIGSGKPLRVAGTLEQGARLTLAGRPVPVRGGRFAVLLRTLPAHRIRFRASDAVGNTAVKAIRVELVPRLPAAPVRAVHMTFDAWAAPVLRDPILRLIDQHKIDAVELDIKDERGTVGWDAPVPLAHSIGAVQKIVDLPAAVKLLHSKGVRVIGRVVAFRDPILATAAWQAGRRDEVVQTPSGGQYLASGYGGFTNFADPVVRKYNVDIAVAAARAGVDDILYDYVRRPDGPISTMVFPKLKGSPETAIAGFVRQAHLALKPYGTFLGASVFGVAVTRPTEVAQNIKMMAPNLDYVAPMVYPSHWGPGEYGVTDPNSEPYLIVLRSLRDFAVAVKGTGARLVPWLQDFSLGVHYGTAEVRAQIDAARADGIDEFLLWSPAASYTSDALPVGKQRAASGVKPNELGLVPVVMYHQLRDHGSVYDIGADQFRAELQRLWTGGYVPVRASDLVNGTIGLPAGKSPVVLTFDDSTNNQVAFRGDGSLDPGSAVGILEDFAKTHPGFTPTATFFVIRDSFIGNGKTPDATLQWLVAHGYEIGDHTRDHLALRNQSDTAVQQQLVLGQRLIHSALPQRRIDVMALPQGSYPRNARLAVSGRWDGESYRFGGVFLVGANPSHSPFSVKFDPANIPRIRSSPAAGTADLGSTYWLDWLDAHPADRYVSDGNPDTITFPAAEQGSLAARFRSRARPY